LKRFIRSRADDDVGGLGTVPISGREQGRVDDADMSKTTTTQWRPKSVVFKAQQPGLSTVVMQVGPIRRPARKLSVLEDALTQARHLTLNQL
jgi:hypothetical protein